ncbi:hypothetical protein BAUCODRAFT_146262 [Baudoinia panamericana UAMH 10762]|uniref:Uncharacterized protein n=1 Tax=Baudoinia panamericana (strain UAMH 10762) TaxID=717646 RepID=M2NJH9_BAUPA|nr:uncharacterized protein BAUCODRAFT_146262 [Baudoinia panamericana UAMH 10762]EMC99300.1 hypothetical protein BAUCODRAFT_146262 [Baudoinia panamericana UAMH 10762]
MADDKPMRNGHADQGASLGFVVDTAGDATLGQLAPSLSKKVRKQGEPDPLFTGAVSHIVDKKPLAIVDTEGNETFRWEPHMPVPMDPRLWQGVVVKELPKAVRKVRRDWMAARRAEKKSRESQGSKAPLQKKSKGQRKVEAREDFVKKVLHESRQAVKNAPDGVRPAEIYVSIDGINDVPLVKVESLYGPFKKGELALARTVARRVLRNVKRALKAEKGKGKGKGWKKRERAAKDAATNAGISGFVDRARIDVKAGSAVKDLLL